MLFTGDTVLDGMYSVVSPNRGGDMAVYVQTLERLRRLRLARICPGHGDVIEEPKARLDELPRAPPPARPADPQARPQEGRREDPRARRHDLRPTRTCHRSSSRPPGWQIHAHLLELKADGKVVGTSAKAAWKLVLA